MVRALTFVMISRLRTLLVLKNDPDMSNYIVENAKVSDFITSSRYWNNNSLVNILSDHIINKIKSIPIPIFYIKENIKWKFTSHGGFSVKSATWGNSNMITPHPKAAFLKYLTIKSYSKYQIFCWKLTCQKLLIRDKLRKIGLSINGDCPLYHSEEETIDH